MAITYVEIDTSLLETDVQELNASITKAQKSLEGLKTELEELYGMWSGQASRAFMVQAGKDYIFMKGILNDLKKMTECMTHASKEYVRCENQVSELVNDIRM